MTLRVETSDIIILGSGFAGSILAMILSRLGRRVVVIDRASHPRFAIGESSTPVANFVLRDLAMKYDLSRLLPLTKYGPWKRTYPDIGCGLKRGFSYFKHEDGADFSPANDHHNELLVAASSDNEHSDTQWFRADVDAFLAGELSTFGVPSYERTQVTAIERNGSNWKLTANSPDGLRHFSAPFVVDGTGEATVLARSLGIKNDLSSLETHSRTIFTHVRQLRRFHEMLDERGGRVADHPFGCDDAAEHHVLTHAWMWQLRFDQGITSVGFVLDDRQHRLDETISPEDEWSRWLCRYPSLKEMFAATEIVDPPGRIVRTKRIQRRLEHAVGDGWAALPHTAGFIDPLHSSGIAHSLCGIEKLGTIFEKHWGKPTFAAALADYERSVFAEVSVIDRMVAGCYRTTVHFPLFVAFSMLYFAAATTFERYRIERNERESDRKSHWFLCADDPEFVAALNQSYSIVADIAKSGESTTPEINAAVAKIAKLIEPFNRVGLFDPASQNMYRHTVAE